MLNTEQRTKSLNEILHLKGTEKPPRDTVHHLNLNWKCNFPGSLVESSLCDKKEKS